MTVTGIRRAGLRNLCVVLVLCLLAIPATAGKRTPMMQVQLGELADDRAWDRRVEDDSFVRALEARVPAGSSFSDWRERVEEEVHFTPSTLTNYLKIWLIQQKMKQSDLNVLETVHGTAATLYIYRIPSADLIVVRKFMQAPDGVYMIAYHAKEKGIDYARYETWLKAIETATLVRREKKKSD